MIKPALLLLPLLAVFLRAQSLEAPVLPSGATAVEVAPNADLTLKYHFLAAGKQIYKCEAGAWSKASSPDADLTQLGSALNVHHSAGPTWTFTQGQGSVKAIGATAAHYKAPDGVSIDWLKLDADKSSRTGDFSNVTVIQRLYTGAGQAPKTSCSGSQTYDSPYTAHYYFWSTR